jgi:hypothetical protein
MAMPPPDRRSDATALSPLVSVRDVAVRAGWAYRRMLRHLQALDVQAHGMLLVKQGTGRHTRYSLTLDALKSVNPQWFQRVSGLAEDVEHLDTVVGEHDELLEATMKAVGELRARCRMNEQRIEALEQEVREFRARGRSPLAPRSRRESHRASPRH